MNLFIDVDGVERQTTLADLIEGSSVEELEPGVYSIVRQGRSFVARVAGSRVDIDGRTFEVTLRDPRAMTRRGADAGGSGRQSIKAPMPGKVVRVLVAAGDTVEAGQGLVVVEAMKMQNELKSPKAGTVIKVSAETGATVSPGDVLVIVE